MVLDGTVWSWSTLGDVTAVDGGARCTTVSEVVGNEGGAPVGVVVTCLLVVVADASCAVLTVGGAWCNSGSISP